MHIDRATLVYWVVVYLMAFLPSVVLGRFAQHLLRRETLNEHWLTFHSTLQWLLIIFLASVTAHWLGVRDPDDHGPEPVRNAVIIVICMVIYALVDVGLNYLRSRHRSHDQHDNDGDSA